MTTPTQPIIMEDNLNRSQSMVIHGERLIELSSLPPGHNYATDWHTFYQENKLMVDTTRHFERTIRDLETKLSRQQSAVITTLEMIEAIKALRDKEQEANAKSTQQKTERPKL